MSPETSERMGLVMRLECLFFGSVVAICVLPVVLGSAMAQAKTSADYAVVISAIHQEEDAVDWLMRSCSLDGNDGENEGGNRMAWSYTLESSFQKVTPLMYDGSLTLERLTSESRPNTVSNMFLFILPSRDHFEISAICSSTHRRAIPSCTQYDS